MAKKKAQNSNDLGTQVLWRPQDPWIPKPWPTFPPNLTDASFNRSTREGCAAWVQWCFCTMGFEPNGGFKGWKPLKQHLFSLSQGQVERDTIGQLMKSMLQNQGSEPYSFPMLDKDGEPMWAKIRKIFQNKLKRSITATEPSIVGACASSNDLGAIQPASLAARPSTQAFTSTPRVSLSPPQSGHAPSVTSREYTNPDQAPKYDLLARQLDQLQLKINKGKGRDVSQDGESSYGLHGYASPGVFYTPGSETGFDLPEQVPQYDGNMVDFDAMDVLLTDENSPIGDGTDRHAEIRHAPLVDENVVRDKNKLCLLPQYGLMGTHDQNIDNPKSKLFLNTNIPFSAFVCGVQGSGKSHTTSCILENCLIPSTNLGRLQEPLSALVFSYGLFTGDGAGFSISEAAFLGASAPRFGHAHVKNIHVLVCDTNLRRIEKLYERLPNVTVSAFKLDPRNLDIDLMLTLMNMDESGRMPLYMGAVTQIIREMATASEYFDYRVFKKHLSKQKFSPDQENMLSIRLGLLESFLDLKKTCQDDILYKPGEVTIMDMSCPFVDVNTACIMFRCGLQRYLQSKASGKLVVLDEAHKYMLDVPGARGLNQVLVDTIRMQRHTGTRVVISTQEPTLLTDLIALCSIAVIHRFSSPEWLTAIRRHIRIAAEDREALMEQIEGLSTGTAIVYSPNSILGYVDGSTKKGTGTMMKVKMRKRITVDGGQSVLAV